VLFLDELVEFRTATLDALRQVLEEGHVTVGRMRATFPANPLLVASVNPCLCGYLGQPSRPCICTTERIRSYRARLAGPVYERFDLKVVLMPMDIAQCAATPRGDASSVVRERVVHARARQLIRASDPQKACTNSELTAEELEQVAVPDAAGSRLLAQTAERHGVAREKVLRIARTIADLEGSDTILAPHIAEAVQVHSYGASG
jgi:magnesium chelatase family protein